jgi:hypothetical protein
VGLLDSRRACLGRSQMMKVGAVCGMHGRPCRLLRASDVHHGQVRALICSRTQAPVSVWWCPQPACGCPRVFRTYASRLRPGLPLLATTKCDAPGALSDSLPWAQPILRMSAGLYKGPRGPQVARQAAGGRAGSTKDQCVGPARYAPRP